MEQTRDVMPGGVDDVSQGLDVPEAELARLVLRLELQGTIDLGTRTALDEALGDLGARVRYLDVDDAKLAVEPTEDRSEEHTSELQSLMRISYAVFCLKKKTKKTK